MTEICITFQNDKFRILFGPAVHGAELHQTATIEGAIVHGLRECYVLAERLGKMQPLKLVIDSSVGEHFKSLGYDGDPTMRDT